MFALICVSFLLIGFGLLQIFAPDMMWSLTEWNNQMKGLSSERTETWDMGRVASGVILIFAGAGLGLWGLSANAEQTSREIERTAVAVSTAQGREVLVTTLDRQFIEALPRLKRDAVDQPQRIAASSIGLNIGAGAQLDFGRCAASDAIYVYIIGYGPFRDDLAYSSSRSMCRHPYLVSTSAERLGESTMGGTWFQLPYFYDSMAQATAAYSFLVTETPSGTAAISD